jgi:hypothetical protein
MNLSACTERNFYGVHNRSKEERDEHSRSRAVASSGQIEAGIILNGIALCSRACWQY